MAFVEIYGQSDDLIEVEGHIYEEFNPHNSDGEPDYLVFSDGTVLSVEYGASGIWRFNRVFEGTAAYSKTEGNGHDGNYTDRVRLEGDIRWCIFGSRIEKATETPRR